MIDPKELRIGNLVDFKGGHYKVIEIRLMPELKPSGYWLTLEGFDNPVHCLEVEGVEITEEWLYENRFKMFKIADFINIDMSIYLNDDYGSNIFYEEGSGNIQVEDEWIAFDKSHIHHLQNIFFDLTGKEL